MLLYLSALFSGHPFLFCKAYVVHCYYLKENYFFLWYQPHLTALPAPQLPPEVAKAGLQQLLAGVLNSFHTWCCAGEEQP